LFEPFEYWRRTLDGAMHVETSLVEIIEEIILLAL
jgi:hypothetical protein